ncbi:toll/interleukin-1 receptor domain-containing protein [Halomonas sp. N3-2A]|uniref:toll/interleukin-1 receptor domain-containing protein n=1 Tax=Halomonas sp. N3-2A TaxID=2014541 RepID=UPI000B5B40D2|nr:toll/interleukin-1 receptor domain-containing protein [Halomonas sp. N3-2A]ASK18077.1 hypothetical protein CEK60_01630 [Halomonas sp. N3-2A]
MQKPTVFISHSSVDKDLIFQIKSLVRGRTSGTVDLFQSSDGESIPFGNNWIHQVEENLNKSKIMFVFVSPRSAMSSWIYFEAGFAYSKGIKVIPIGIDGVDIGSLKPPLNLLQGFNVSSAEGLNNIIAVLNREFGCSYSESFSNSDYDRLSVFISNDKESSKKVLNIIDNVELLFPNKMRRDNEGFSIIDDPLAQVEKLLTDSDIDFRRVDENTVHTHGTIIRYKEGSGSGVVIVLDPFCLKLNEQLINDLVKVLYPEELLIKHWARVFFNEDVLLLTKDFKVSSKLHVYGFSMSDLNGKMHRYESLDFALEPAFGTARNRDYESENLRVVYDAGQFDTDLLCSLIEELMKAGIVLPSRNS